MLVATGTLTIARARAARGNTIALPPTINLSSTVPVRSIRHWHTEFSDYSWGRTTRSYVKLADALPDAEFETLIEDAQEYVEATRARIRSPDVADVVDEDEDPRAFLVDNPESDEESEDPRACLVDNTDSDEESEDSHACLVDNSTDSDEECKSSSFSSLSLT